jgi:prolyl oligopeptidase PreP (S9A serine peptidase family)
MIRCSANEHYYDNDKHSSCPFCGSAREIEEETSFISSQRDDTDKTKIVRHTEEAETKTVLNNLNQEVSNEPIETKLNKEMNQMQDQSEKTIAPWARKDIKDTKSNRTNQETVVSKSKFSDAPVVGWLVIIEGNKKGQDYRIIPGINTIGRDNNNTIQLNTDDKEISREKHCLIEYEVKNKTFYLERGTTTTYLNDKRVGGDGSELKSGDIIEIGVTKLKFISFCSSEFCWDM